MYLRINHGLKFYDSDVPATLEYPRCFFGEYFKKVFDSRDGIKIEDVRRKATFVLADGADYLE
ncbi:MAG: hypothetical protein JXB42_07750 [Deltaproteobacteria bacterium]|nr:hypothetical protein [Deltaproteobacteria bacterium]